MPNLIEGGGTMASPSPNTPPNKSSSSSSSKSTTYTTINGIEIEGSLYTGNFDNSKTVAADFDPYPNKKSKHAILGMPLLFTELTDPRQRVIKKTIMTDLPLVTIVPGRPRFFKAKTPEGEVYKADDIIVTGKQIGRAHV